MSRALSIDTFEAQLGAFARIFREENASALATRFNEHGLTQMQFNFSALGYPSIPGQEIMATIDLAEIRDALDSRGVRMWGVSGTYNMAHPEPSIRDANTALAAAYIAGLAPLRAEAVTLCTGSRDPEHMWRRHADNGSEAAWTDFRRSLDALLPAAVEAGLKLAIEPEPGNVVRGTREATRLVAALGDDADRIGFILDAANLVDDAPAPRHASILGEAFGELGARTLCLHGKDPNGWEAALEGNGGVDYGAVLDLYRTLPKPVPFIIQDATDEQMPNVVAYIRDAFRRGHSE